ncbi:MAG: hypothetical protein GXW89_20160 [Phycisphaerae bacterium]|nr:hypothetical protein [Phycisphaerae bacterium]
MAITSDRESLEPIQLHQPLAASRPRASAALLAAVLMLAASGLMFELILTRIFSATIWYHYAFVAISVALFGWGLGGFLVFLLRLGQHPRLKSILPLLAMLPGLLMPVFLIAILQFPFKPQYLIAYFLLSLLPFLAGGAALSLVFEAYGSDANRLYFADLSGAALGVLGVPLVIGLFGAETAVLATAILPAMAAVLLAWSADKAQRPRVLPLMAVALLAAIVGLVAWNHHSQPFTIRDAPDKALYKFRRQYPGSRLESDKWNVYSRITSVRSPDADNLARIFIDSDNWTNVMHWDGNPAHPADGRNWFRAVPFRVSEKPRVMIIGPGGATDVVLAIAAGSPMVTAVEMNPLIIDAVQAFGDEAGRVYDHPNVDLVMSEGRNFVERTPEKYDVIMLGFVDTFAAVSSGGLSLTENYLYTREAIEAYYDRLTDDGVLAIVRWPVDVRRLVANAVDFLSARGMSIEQIGGHIMTVAERDPAWNTTPSASDELPPETLFLLSRSPLTPERVDKLLAGHQNLYVLHAPGREPAPDCPQYRQLFSGKMSFAEYTDSFETLATPVTDDRPFYFAYDKPLGMHNFVLQWFGIPIGIVIAFTLVLLLAGKRAGFRPPGPRTVAYFGALGLGFIICEIALMQRLILLLGHPIYTLVVILFTILLASSLGSLYARRFAPEQIHRRLGVIIALVIVLVATASVALPPVVRAALPLGLYPRIALAVAMVFPFGFLMGMPFPLGLRRMALDPTAAPVSALWGINGVASVVGSIFCIVLAVIAGFTWVFVAGALCYALAWITRPR